MTEIAVGDQVRVYDAEEWFYQGEVKRIDSRGVTVDFGDWETLFPANSFSHTIELHSDVFIATSQGVRVKEYFS